MSIKLFEEGNEIKNVFLKKEFTEEKQKKRKYSMLTQIAKN